MPNWYCAMVDITNPTFIEMSGFMTVIPSMVDAGHRL